MASRRNPSATPAGASTHTPLSSGPRCVSGSIICSACAASSSGPRPAVVRSPAKPHMMFPDSLNDVEPVDHDAGALRGRALGTGDLDAQRVAARGEAGGGEQHGLEFLLDRGVGVDGGDIDVVDIDAGDAAVEQPLADPAD